MTISMRLRYPNDLQLFIADNQELVITASHLEDM